MAADVPARRAATTSYEGTFAGARLLLSSGAAPISDGADEGEGGGGEGGGGEGECNTPWPTWLLATR